MLGEHIAKDPGRSPYLPLLPELLEYPQEAWLGFYRHKRSGEIALRVRMLKLIKTDRGEHPLLFVANARRGQLEAWTFFQIQNIKQINKRRRGRLIAASEENGQ